MIRAPVCLFLVNDLKHAHNYFRNINPTLMAKYKWITAVTLIFFLLTNTTYFWQGYLGPWAMHATVLLALLGLALMVIALKQFNEGIKEKFKNRQRLFLLTILTTVLILSVVYPRGIIDFDKLQGTDVLIATREGAANCTTILALKGNGKFYVENICFGVYKASGTYTMQNDTIKFKYTGDRDSLAVYSFAIIKPKALTDKTDLFDIYLFKNDGDSLPLGLDILKNNMEK